MFFPRNVKVGSFNRSQVDSLLRWERSIFLIG